VARPSRERADHRGRRLSGVFALLDPGGVDHEATLAALRRVDFRGDPILRSAGAVAVGTYVDGTDSSRITTRGDRMFVSDATIHGTVPGTRASWRSAEPEGSALIEQVLLDLGPAELIGVAGDYAVACADRRHGRLVVARDAFGSRQLFWARSEGVYAFASDIEVLESLGLADGTLDADMVSAFLSLAAVGEDQAHRTAFHGVNTVRAGHWIEVGIGQKHEERRWFIPDRLAPPVLGVRSGVAAVHDTVVEAAAARASGRTVALELSGGRDSGSVAVALRDAGVEAVCLTYSFDPDVQPSETEPARALAERMGHRWVPVRCDAPDRSELDRVPGEAGTPMVAPSWSLYLRTRRAARSAGADVILTGDGGEPLFQAAPRSVIDLALTGRLRQAAAASRNFHYRWKYPFWVQAKGALRLAMPPSVLAWRERARPAPPWVVPRDLQVPPRLERWREHDRLTDSLTDSEAYSHDMGDRLCRAIGMEEAAPLFDLRVVRVAIGLPLELRSPVSSPKPALRQAFLGDFEATRVKGSLAPYVYHVARTLQRDDPELFAPDSLCVGAGYVLPEGLAALAEPRWLHHSINVALVENWLRTRLHSAHDHQASV
jgi:asparagine synthetase B (glutamine-hydrolysing)